LLVIVAATAAQIASYQEELTPATCHRGHPGHQHGCGRSWGVCFSARIHMICGDNAYKTVETIDHQSNSKALNSVISLFYSTNMFFCGIILICSRFTLGYMCLAKVHFQTQAKKKA